MVNESTLVSTPRSRTPQVPGWLRWAVPDLAMAAAGVTLLLVVFLFDGGQKLFRDSDTGWHIRTGEIIMGTASMPRTDPYSYSRPGGEWFAWEWGADVLMGAAHRWNGLRGVALLYAMAIAACTWLWFRLTWEMGGDFLLACLFASPLLTTANIHWLARPHVFGWVLVMVAVLLLERRQMGLPEWAALGCLWANIHGSFVLGPVLIGCYAAGRHRPHGRYALAGAAFLVGTIVNPYGLTLHRHVAKYLGNRELLARVGEFQTFNFMAEGSTQILLAVGIAGAGAVLALTQSRWAHFLACAILVAMAIRSARMLPVMALVALPMANAAIRRALPAGCAGFIAYTANLRRIDAGLRGWLAVPVLAGMAWAGLSILPSGFSPDQFPVAAAAKVAELPAGARVLAPDKFGGYLIYRFAGERKVFFDGRSDYYGTEFMKEYIRLVQVRPGWREIAARHAFTHALLPVDYSLVDALQAEGWRESYRDKTAVLLEKGV